MCRFLFYGRVFWSLAACGCSESTSIQTHAGPVEVAGKVTLAGKPASDLMINFQPTSAGLPAVAGLKNGEFIAALTPGQYTWYLSPAISPKVFETVRQPYREGALDRILVVEATTSTLELAVGN